MNLWRVAIDEDSGRVPGLPEQVTTPSAHTSHLGFSRDGRRLAYVNRVEIGNIYRVDFDPTRETIAGSPVPVTHGSWLALGPDVSPDGQWVAFSTWRKPEEVFVCRVDGSGLRQLTDDDSFDCFPLWSPDGKRLAFRSNRSGTNQIWTMAPDGSDLRQLTRLQDPGAVRYMAWSPDGAHLAFSGDRATMILEIGKPWDERSLERLPPLESPNVWFQPGRGRRTGVAWLGASRQAQAASASPSIRSIRAATSTSPTSVRSPAGLAMAGA
jgi:Tol biopolymer transport system component